MPSDPAGLKVLHLIPSISARRGGPSEAVLAMVAALREQGVQAAIVSTNDDGPGVLDLPLQRWIDVRGVPVLLFPRWSPPLHGLREFALSVPLLRWLHRHLRDWDLLHVHALFSFPSTAGMALARRQRVPYLVRSIGQLNAWSLRQSAWRKWLFLALVERRNLEGAAALQATSALEAADLAALGLRAPVWAIPLGVALPPLNCAAARHALECLDSRFRPGEPRLLFLGRLHPKKQLEVLLEALALLSRRRPAQPWQLLIAGQGEPHYERELRVLAERLGIQHRLLWLGQVSGAPKQELLQGCDWFLLPSAAENFAIAAAEALAAGTPVVLSPQVGLAEAVQAAGAGVVCEANPADLAQCLERILAADGQQTWQGARARRLAESSFAWPAVAERLIEAYRTLVPQP